MIVVGVTGGIGSGKTTVAALLARRGARVIDLDEIARQVAAPGGAAYDALVDHFGQAVVRTDGTLDRAAIADRVFSDPDELATLNGLTHPAIAVETARRLASVEPGDRVVVLDIPLLAETTRQRYGLAGVIVVDVAVEIAVGRLVEHRNITERDARARVGAQASREDRRRLADVVIDNSGSLQDLDVAVDGVWAWLQALADRQAPPHR